ncbi:MAG: YybS family protein [Halanaerobiales bacterium]|nr:YybS family protein [Halanaerobiales bacterium]
MLKEEYVDGIKVLLLIFLLTILNLNIPIISFLVNIILPVPVVYMIIKHGMNKTFFMILLSAVLSGLLIDPLMGLYTIIGFGLIGFVLGSALKEEFSPRLTLILTISAVLISNLIISGISSYLLDFNYHNLFNEIIEGLGSNPDLTELALNLEQQLELLKMLIPAFFVITSIISGTITYYLTLWYLKRIKLNKRVYKPIKYWYFTRWISVGIAICLLFKTNIYLVNLNMVLLFFVFLQGFAVGLYYLAKSPNSSGLTFLYILLIILFNFFVFIILSLVGLIDMWFNLRKRKE